MPFVYPVCFRSVCRMSIIGLEVFFETVERELSSPEDAVVALIHWLMINNDFVCIGNGETVEYFSIHKYILILYR